MGFSYFIIFGVLFLDVIGISLIIPAFPELKAYYQINDFQVTLGLTIYSLCAFFTTPLLGQLSDKYGRKGLLLRCVAGTCLSYIVLIFTKQYWLFLLSRAINGATGGNISIIQAILTDISPDQATKHKSYGVMGALFGIGFIIGPIIGSLILQFADLSSIFVFGALFAALELLLLWMYFYDVSKPDHKKSIKFDTIGLLRSYLNYSQIKTFLRSMICLGMGGFIINASQSLYMQKQFQTSGAEYGYFLAFAGLISAVNMGRLIPHFRIRNFSNKILIIISHISLIIGYVIVGQTSSFVTFTVAFYTTVLLSGMYINVYNVQIMSQSSPDQIGTISGMLGGLQSLVMVLGPFIGGVLMMFDYNIFVAAVVCFIVSLVLMLKRLRYMT